MIDLIYCADGNRRFAEIAIAEGYHYGAQLPNTIYHAPYFVDQNWRKPDREKYMSALAQHRPHIATVLDLELDKQLPEVLEWAEETAALVEVIVIIPKAQGIIASLPRTVGGKEVRLGYSVPTKYAGTQLPVWEFVGWPVHLLGGAPQNQLCLAHYLNVRSADGNATQKAAMHGVTWAVGKWNEGKEHTGRDFMYRAFEISCRNVVAAWKQRYYA